MATQLQLDNCYMVCAEAHASLSKAIRKKVGAALVTETGIVIAGVNGLPKQLGNDCENVKHNYPSNGGIPELVTKPEVIHAELNCILKAAKEGVSVLNSTLYVTLSPCVDCASMILSAGIKRIVYKEEYRCNAGVELLRNHLIVDKL